jgi:Subunit CCDC53 of WASH complex
MANIGEASAGPASGIPDQKVLALVNAYVVNTACLLNQYSVRSETKLMALHQTLVRTDAQLALLEAQLHSIEAAKAAAEEGAADKEEDPSQNNSA